MTVQKLKQGYKCKYVKKNMAELEQYNSETCL